MSLADIFDQEPTARMEIKDQNGEVIYDKDGIASYMDLHPVAGPRGEEVARKNTYKAKEGDPWDVKRLKNVSYLANFIEAMYLVNPNTKEGVEIGTLTHDVKVGLLKPLKMQFLCDQISEFIAEQANFLTKTN